jgi:arylsulfatase A-like enzyme
MKILVLNAAALHLGYLGCYGNEWVATAALDRLAAEGVVFDQHYADRPGAARSCWTGRYQFPAPQATEPPAPAPDLRELLEANGVPFVHVTDPGPLPPDAAEGTSLERTLEAVLDTLDHLGAEERWLVWVDLPSLQPPWQVAQEFLDRYFAQPADAEGEPEEEGEELEADEPLEEEEELEEELAEEIEEDEIEPLTPLTDVSTGPIDAKDLTLLERLQATYAAAVTQLDTAVGLLVEELGHQGLLDALALVVTADQGLALGEHGIVGAYRPWLHDELIHLPLILRLPGRADAGLRISALTQPVDLLPTLLDLLGLPEPESHGHSLLPLVRGEKEQVRSYACAGLELGGGLEWALRTAAWGFLLPLRTPPGDAARGPQLYVKPDDRWEVNNLVQHHLEFAERLEQTLRAFIEATRKPGALEAPELPAEEAGEVAG